MATKRIYNKRHLVWYFLIGFAFGIFFTVFFTNRPALATQEERVCFCHNVNHNPHTICTAERGLIRGHILHVRGGGDTYGECRVEPTPTEQPEATPTDVPDVTPTATPTQQPSNDPGPKGPPEWEEPCFYIPWAEGCRPASFGKG